MKLFINIFEMDPVDADNNINNNVADEPQGEEMEIEVETENQESALREALEKVLPLVPPVYYDKVQSIEDFSDVIDLPPKVINTPSGKFLATEYNRSCDSFRAPTTLSYYNSQGDAVHDYGDEGVALEHEKSAREAFTRYAQMYYGGEALVSAYAWHPAENKLAVCIAIHKGLNAFYVFVCRNGGLVVLFRRRASLNYSTTQERMVLLF